jgi:hypothetical protein
MGLGFGPPGSSVTGRRNQLVPIELQVLLGLR